MSLILGRREREVLGALMQKPGALDLGAAHRPQARVGLALEAGADAELLSIASEPHRRSQGLGRAIMRALDAEAVRRGLQRWILEVARNNLPAIGLYSSEGFVEIGVRKAYYQGETGRIDALVMSRTVTPEGGQERA